MKFLSRFLQHIHFLVHGIVMIYATVAFAVTSAHGLDRCESLFHGMNHPTDHLEILPESSKKPQQWLMEISDFILDRFRKGHPELLPKLHSTNLTEVRLAQALERLKQDFMQEDSLSFWWEMFSAEVQNILTDANAQRPFRKHKNTWISELSTWTRQLKEQGEPIRTPRIDALDPNEVSLARALDRHKQRIKKEEDSKNWWESFPEDVQQMWAEEGILEKRKRTDEEWIAEISEWVVDVYQSSLNEKVQSFSPRSTAKNPKEKSLGIGLANLKRKHKEKHSDTFWWEEFPKKIQIIWLETRVLPAMYRSRILSENEVR
jgi:hypothetical protein